MRLGPAKRLAVYLDESTRAVGGGPLYEAILGILHREGMAGVSVLRGVAGFGSEGRVHSSRLLDLSEDLPMMIVAVDEAENIARALPLIEAEFTHGLVEISDTEVVLSRRAGGHGPSASLDSIVGA